MRSAEITRKTNETSIIAGVNLDGTGRCKSETGIGFFDHMIDQLARHSMIDITLKAKGDLHIDDHHTVEDCGIALGQALARALGDKLGIRRYGHFNLAMDDAQI
ncbi:MAG: imidazoleglycerol-phosphate dehydratase, partial [Cypionkella sp.]